jgi:hypothetical protein
MDWVLRYSRAKSAYDQIMNGRMWRTPNTQAEIRQDLQMRGLLVTGSGFSFGPPMDSMEARDKSYITSQSVSSGYSSAIGMLIREVQGFIQLDDLMAALGSFSFHVVVGGEVRPLSNLTRISGAKLMKLRFGTLEFTLATRTISAAHGISASGMTSPTQLAEAVPSCWYLPRR